jgi:hypothetical protein
MGICICSAKETSLTPPCLSPYWVISLCSCCRACFLAETDVFQRNQGDARSVAEFQSDSIGFGAVEAGVNPAGEEKIRLKSVNNMRVQAFGWW